MPARTYIQQINGVNIKVTPLTVGGTPTQAGEIAALDANGRLDPSLMPVGVVADTITAAAFEALSAGDYVYVRTSDNLIAKASAAAGGNVAIGFVLQAFAAAASATVFLEGRNTSLTGIVVGTRYYLSDTVAGAITATAPTATGTRTQFVGNGVTSTSVTSVTLSDYTQN